jgi:hypothetical protein
MSSTTRPEIERRSPPRAAFCAVPWWIALSCIGCIPTDLEPIPPAPVCKAVDVESAGPDSVVRVISRLGAIGDMRCSGVAIAPSLVLTGLGCVAHLNDPEVSDPIASMDVVAGVATAIWFAAVRDYSAICDSGWSLVEDGSFEGWLGEPLDPSSIEVGVQTREIEQSGTNELPTVKVEHVFTSHSSTRCRDDIAVLQLEEPLDVLPLPLRLASTDALSEPVILSNFCNSGGTNTRRDTPSQVEAVTEDAADPLLPPRSLQLAGELGLSAPGGAVLSADTGTLIGMIVSGTKRSCESQTTEGTTIAARLMPFRRMLLDAATAADEVLWLEPDTDEPTLTDAPDCAQR